MSRALLTLLFTATFAGSSFFSSFTGFEANQLPIPQINPPVQPAGYAFAIWGLIYGWLSVSAMYGIWKRGRDPAWAVMRAPLIVSLALGTPWLWVATQSAIAATVLIFAMTVPALLAALWAPAADRWWARAPVAIYAGWLTAASFVSLGSTAAGYGVMFGQIGWAFAGITLTLVVAICTQIASRAPSYGLTVIWALVGILVANGLTAVGIYAVAGILAVAAVLFVQNRPV